MSVCVYECVYFTLISISDKRPFKWTYFLKFPPKPICTSLVCRACYMFNQHLHLYSITPKIFLALKIMKLLIVQTPPVLLYLVFLKAKLKNIFWDNSAFYSIFNLLYSFSDQTFSSQDICELL